MAGAIHFFIPYTADASSKRYKPIPICSTIQFWSITFLSALHTGAPYFHQRGRINPWNSIRKHSQITDRERALFVINTDWDQSNACSNVLKRKIKSFLVYWPNLTNFCVEFKNAVAQVHLGKALISCNSINFCVLVRLEFYSMRLIWLHVVEIESFLAGSQYPWNTVAVPQGKLHFHINFLCSITGDPVCSKPVVLVWFHHITYLVSMNGTIVFIHFSYGIPLERKQNCLKTKKKIYYVYTERPCIQAYIYVNLWLN